MPGRKPKRGFVPINRLAVRTYEEVAKAMGLTPQRIYQIEKSALAKLKPEFERLGWRS